MASTSWASGIEANSSNYVQLNNFSVSIDRINSTQIRVSCSGMINVSGSVLNHGDNTGTYSGRDAYIDTSIGLITIPNVYSASPLLNTGGSRAVGGETVVSVGSSVSSITIKSVRLRNGSANPNFQRQPMTWAYDFSYLSSSWDTLQRLSNGGSSPTLVFGSGDTVPPVIHRVAIGDQTATQYSVFAYITDDVQVGTPKCATWTANNGQDDMKWYDMWSGSWTLKGQTYNYACVVQRSEHNNEYGEYINHVYAYDVAGNNSAVEIKCRYTITVSFNANGGSTPSPQSKAVNYGTNYGTLPTTTRTGYTFTGWWSAPKGGTKYTANSLVTTSENQTLYAQWTPKVYTLTYNGNGGESPLPKRITYDQKYGELAVSTRRRYEFLGWFTDPINGIEVTPETVCDGNATIYAHWKIKILLGRIPIATEENKFVHFYRPHIMTEKGWEPFALHVGDGQQFNPTALNPDDFRQ